MNEFARTPCNQPFTKKLAVTNSSHKRGRNLETRMIDYERTINQGKKDYSGFHKPGSNKK